jgi:two-component system nitrate/nitrite response regulator NarL
VSAYGPKDSERGTICEAVAPVVGGQAILAPQVQAGLAGEVRAREHESRPALGVSERAAAVAEAMRRGLLE